LKQAGKDEAERAAAMDKFKQFQVRSVERVCVSVNGRVYELTTTGSRAVGSVLHCFAWVGARGHFMADCAGLWIAGGVRGVEGPKEEASVSLRAVVS
jgi:hypothetical protein